MQGFSRAQVVEGPLDEVPPEGLRKIWWWAVVIAVGGFLLGFDTGVISGAPPVIRTDFALDSFEQGGVVSVLVLGAMAGALLSGRMADRIGRRRALGLEESVLLVGTAVAAPAGGYGTLLGGRPLLGPAVGAASATVPVYLSEISPPSVRGSMLTLDQPLITIGVLVACMVNVAFAGAGDWRAMIAMGAVPALVVGVTLAAVQQCGGIDTIIDYAPTITEETGLSAADSIYYSIAIGQGETFWIFGAIALAGLAFVARFVPEAKGRGFDEADADLRRRFGHPPPEGTPE